MRKALASGAVAFMLVTGGATAASAQTTPAPATEQKEDNSGKLGLLGLLGLAGLAGLAKKKDNRAVDNRGATSVGSSR